MTEFGVLSAQRPARAERRNPASMPLGAIPLDIGQAEAELLSDRLKRMLDMGMRHLPDDRFHKFRGIALHLLGRPDGRCTDQEEGLLALVGG